MKIFVLVSKNIKLRETFYLRSHKVYCDLAKALQDMTQDNTIIEGELNDEQEIQRCICDGLNGGQYSTLQFVHVKWIAKYFKADWPDGSIS